MDIGAQRWVILGRISGLFGVQGWVKVHSYTDPRDGILGYRDWYLRDRGDPRPVSLERGRVQGKGLVAKLAGCDDRDQASVLVGAEIVVRRSQLAEIGSGEYYWADLEGLTVLLADGRCLGKVVRLIATGANDVLVVDGDRERLIPFLPDSVVLEVDPAQGLIRVDWDPDF